MGQQVLRNGPAGRRAFLEAAPAAGPEANCYFSDWVAVGQDVGLQDRQGVRDRLSQLPVGTVPMLFGLFVDDDLGLLAIDVLGLGTVDNIRPGVGQIIRRARSKAAKGVVLAYAARTDFVKVSRETLEYVATLRATFEELDVPILDYLVVGPSRTFGIGSW